MPTIRADRDGEVLRIRLNRPERRNALGPAEWDALDRLIAAAAAAADVETVVLSAEGPVFCAGVDRAMIEAARAEPGGLERQVGRVGGVVAALERLPQSVVVRLDGPAVGIGVHVVLAADFVLARRDAYLWLPEGALGLPDAQHHAHLAARLGPHKALSVALLGERLGAEAASAAGLIGPCFDNSAALEAACDDLLHRLQAVDPRVRRAVKEAAIRSGPRGDPEVQLRAVRRLQ